MREDGNDRFIGCTAALRRLPRPFRVSGAVAVDPGACATLLNIS